MIPYALTATARQELGWQLPLESNFCLFPTDPTSKSRYESLTMSGGIFSNGIGSAVSQMFASNAGRINSTAMQSRITAYKTQPKTAQPPPPPESKSAKAALTELLDDVPEPWPAAADAPKTSRRRAKAAAARVDPLVDGDDEDEEDDDDFDGHQSDSSDDESSGSDDSDDESGSEPDAEQILRPPPKPLTNGKAKEKAAPAEVPKKKVRKTDKELLAEEHLRIYGRPIEDEEEEERNGIDIGSSSDEEGDDDDEEDDDADEMDDADIVRDDESRIRDCVNFKRHVIDVDKRKAAIPSEKGSLDAVLAFCKERDREALASLFASLAKHGIDVNSAPPEIDESEFERVRKPKKKDADDDDAAGSESDDDDDDLVDDDDVSMIEPDPVESPIHTLIPRVVGFVESEETDLPYILAKLSRNIFAHCLALYRMKVSPTPGAEPTLPLVGSDIGPALAKVWGTSCPFYNRCLALIGAITKRTHSRFNAQLMVTFASGFAAAGLHEFAAEDIYENVTHERAEKASLCAACREPVALVDPAADGTGLMRYYRAYELKQCKPTPIGKDRQYTVTASVATRTRGSSADKTFLSCERCHLLFAYMNQLMSAPYDLVRLAHLWIQTNPKSVLDPKLTPVELAEAFHGWEYRRKRCQAIALAYEMLHVVILR